MIFVVNVTDFVHQPLVCLDIDHSFIVLRLSLKRRLLPPPRRLICFCHCWFISAYTITPQVVDKFLWIFLREGAVSLASNHSILMLLRFAIRIQDFLTEFLSLRNMGNIVRILPDQLPWRSSVRVLLIVKEFAFSSAILADARSGSKLWRRNYAKYATFMFYLFVKIRVTRVYSVRRTNVHSNLNWALCLLQVCFFCLAQ